MPIQSRIAFGLGSLIVTYVVATGINNLENEKRYNEVKIYYPTMCKK